MKPAAFAYHAPETLEEALRLLADTDREVRVLAGGQSLVPMMNFRLAVPEALVDIGRVAELRFVRLGPDGELEVGAGTRQAELLRDDRVRLGWPLLVDGVGHVAHPQVRSRGTVCGSLAHNDPTAELPALALALGARFTLASVNGRREVAADAFFLSYYEVALEPGEMLVSAAFPALEPGTGWSFQELARRRGDFALVGAVCLLRAGGDGAIGTARLVVFGAGGRPLRIDSAEQALIGARGDRATAAEVARRVAAAVTPLSDIHATAAYRRSLAGELAGRCVLEAWERCAHD